MIKKAIRAIIRTIPNGTPVPILAGPLRGLRWSKYGKFTGYISGGYERDLMPIFSTLIRPGQTVYDIGSHHGIYAMMSARLVGKRGAVVAVEPHPDSVVQIHRNRAINHFVGRMTVCELAISDAPGRARFDTTKSQRPGDTGTLIGKLSTVRGHEDVDYTELEGTITVLTITIDALAALYGHPDVVKLDVEGAESLALGGAAHTLSQGKSTWMVSVHNHEEAERCRTIFEAHQYSWRTFGKHRDTIIASNSADIWHRIPQKFLEGSSQKDLYIDL